MIHNIIIDEEFRSLLPALSRATFELLEENILENGCRDPLVLWGDILIDGHNRYEICTRHEIPFNTINRNFESREEALIWIISVQVSRRNLTPLQLSHYRGLHYRADKALKGTYSAFVIGSGASSNSASVKSTAARLAELYNVSRATIERDVKITEAIEAIGEFSYDAKMMVLSGDVNIDKKALAALSTMPLEFIEEIARQIEDGVFDKKKLDAALSANIDDDDEAGDDYDEDIAAGGSGDTGRAGGAGSAGASGGSAGAENGSARDQTGSTRAGQGNSGVDSDEGGAEAPYEPHAIISDITGNFSAELKKLAVSRDSAKLKNTLRSYIDMLEDMYVLM